MSTIEHFTDAPQNTGPTLRQRIATAAIFIVSTLLTAVTLTTVGGLVMVLTFVFSPVLVPLATVLLLGAVALVTPVSFTVAVVFSLRWLYRYFKGRHRSVLDEVAHVENTPGKTFSLQEVLNTCEGTESAGRFHLYY
ncbi:hypothetical protein R1flu_027290 [Riccia fluitans]|uniref:Oleosin n=1 Tax=Riccia fluitans TaxID=41844 RepID=A0ABD1XIF0_9MARC